MYHHSLPKPLGISVPATISSETACRHNQSKLGEQLSMYTDLLIRWVGGGVVRSLSLSLSVSLSLSRARTHTHTYTHTFTRTQTHTHTQTYTNTPTRTHAHTSTHTQAHTRTHTHTHTRYVESQWHASFAPSTLQALYRVHGCGFERFPRVSCACNTIVVFW